MFDRLEFNFFMELGLLSTFRGDLIFRQSDTFPSSFPLTPIVQIAVRPMHQRPPYPTCRLTSDFLAETDHNPSRNFFRRTGQESPKIEIPDLKNPYQMWCMFLDLDLEVRKWTLESKFGYESPAVIQKMAAINKLKNLLWNLKVPTMFSDRPKCGACVSLNRSISSSTVHLPSRCPLLPSLPENPAWWKDPIYRHRQYLRRYFDLRDSDRKLPSACN